MARLLKQAEAKRLGLPGRTSLEPVIVAAPTVATAANSTRQAREAVVIERLFMFIVLFLTSRVGARVGPTH